MAINRVIFTLIVYTTLHMYLQCNFTNIYIFIYNGYIILVFLNGRDKNDITDKTDILGKARILFLFR